MGGYQTIVCGQRSEFVAGAGERQFGLNGQFRRNPVTKFGMCIQTGANRCAAYSQWI